MALSHFQGCEVVKHYFEKKKIPFDIGIEDIFDSFEEQKRAINVWDIVFKLLRETISSSAEDQLVNFK